MYSKSLITKEIKKKSDSYIYVCMQLKVILKWLPCFCAFLGMFGNDINGPRVGVTKLCLLISQLREILI